MRLIISTLMLLLPMWAAAQTAYVTDNLRLGLHQAEDTSDRAFRILESGQPMEIISRNRNYANVRLPDGAEGWVKTAYLVDDKPAKLIVTETLAERDALAAELERLREDFAGPAATIEALEAENANLNAQLAAAGEQIADLQAENAGVEALKERYRGSVPLRWLGGAMALCAVVAFLFGLWWVDYRSRKRHGGIRIY